MTLNLPMFCLPPSIPSASAVSLTISMTFSLDNCSGKYLFRIVIQFEILYKLFIICLANPLMNEIYQTYVASRGLNFI